MYLNKTRTLGESKVLSFSLYSGVLVLSRSTREGNEFKISLCYPGVLSSHIVFSQAGLGNLVHVDCL